MGCGRTICGGMIPDPVNSFDSAASDGLYFRCQLKAWRHFASHKPRHGAFIDTNDFREIALTDARFAEVSGEI